MLLFRWKTSTEIEWLGRKLNCHAFLPILFFLNFFPHTCIFLPREWIRDEQKRFSPLDKLLGSRFILILPSFTCSSLGHTSWRTIHLPIPSLKEPLVSLYIETYLGEKIAFILHTRIGEDGFCVDSSIQIRTESRLWNALDVLSSIIQYFTMSIARFKILSGASYRLTVSHHHDEEAERFRIWESYSRPLVRFRFPKSLTFHWNSAVPWLSIKPFVWDQSKCRNQLINEPRER